MKDIKIGDKVFIPESDGYYSEAIIKEIRDNEVDIYLFSPYGYVKKSDIFKTEKDAEVEALKREINMSIVTIKSNENSIRYYKDKIAKIETKIKKIVESK